MLVYVPGREARAVTGIQCGKVCDHGSPCVLVVCHDVPDRHETKHGCVFFDARPNVTRGVAGDACASGNECGRLGCPECQQ